MNKNLRIFINFLEEYKAYKYFIFLIIVFIIGAAYIEVKIKFDEIELLKNIEHPSKYTEGVRILIFQALKIILYSTIVCLFPIISDYYLTKCYRICICYYIMKALNLNQAAFNSIGPSNIRSIVDRKVYQVVYGFHTLLFSFLYNILFSLWISFFTYKYFNSFVFFYSIFSILTVIFIAIPIGKIRSRVRTKYTEKYDKVIKGIYRIINNYDIIKATNNEEQEIDIFDGCLQYIKHYGIINATLYALGTFLSRIVVIIPNGVFFYFILLGSKKISIYTSAEFVLYNKLFCTLKSKLLAIKCDYVMLLQFYTDIINNDWDEIRCDIEDMAMYFEYQKAEIKEIEFKNIEQSVKIGDTDDMPVNVKKARDYDDFSVIKKTILETQVKDKNIFSDGTEKFSFTEHIKFQEFVLIVDDKILTNPSNFVIYKGEKVALVGKNGSGKSTFLNVFLRYRDYKGAVFIDNTEMKKIYKIDQRNNISFIPQIPGILCGKIIDNLLYNNRIMSINDLEKLCKLYNMHFNDLERDVGENGKTLSGGEKQKIAFLRGVIKNGDIFLLDEPTANMDTQSELNLIDKLHNILYDKTVIAIIHNHTLLKQFDKIIGIVDKDVKVYKSYDEFIEESYLY